MAPGFLTVHGCGSSLARAVEPQRPTGGTDLEPGVGRGRCDAARRASSATAAPTSSSISSAGSVTADHRSRSSRRGVPSTPASPSLRPPGVTGQPAVNQLVEIPRSMLGVPDEANAVVVNLTVTQASGYGYLTAFPCGGDPPTTSNVNYNFGVDRANTAIMALGPQGSLCVQLSESSAHVIVDVNGWLGGTTRASSTAPARKRIADSRNGTRRMERHVRPGSDPGAHPGARPAVRAAGLPCSGSPRRVDGCRLHHRAAVRRPGRGLEPQLRRAAVDITNLTVVPLADDGQDLRDGVRAHPHRRRRVRWVRRAEASHASSTVGPYEVFPAFSADAARLHRLLPEPDGQPRCRCTCAACHARP